MIRHSLNRREFIANVSGGIAAVVALPFYAGALYRPGQKNTGYVYDERYLDYSNNPETPARLIAIENKMAETGLSQEVEKIPLLKEPLPFIQKIYSDTHISSIQGIGITGEVAELAVAAVLGAVQAVGDGTVKNAFCAIRPPGHHAIDGGIGVGFCYYNNVAIAARFIQTVYAEYKKILIIDWDYHHGNATQGTFYEDPSVLFFSTHNWHDYPETGDPAMEGAGAGTGFNINVHLEPGATDDQMKKAWEEKLLPKVDAFKPDFILISAGFDSRTGDKLGKFALTDACFADMTKMAVDIAKQYCNGRLVSMLEGGYTVDGLAKAVTTHIATLIDETSNVMYQNIHFKSRNAYIHGNILYIPSSIQGITGITVRNAAGSVLRKITPHTIHNDLMNLSELGLSAGNYFVEIKTAGRKPVNLTFVCLE